MPNTKQKTTSRKARRKLLNGEQDTRRNPLAIVVPPAPERPWLLSDDEITIVKNSIAKGCSDEELKYCLTVARRYKLDPFKRQIWFVKRWDKNADNGRGGTGAHIWTPTVGIDGLLFTAGRDHKAQFGSVSLPTFGPMIEISKTLKAPEWARVKVFKKGTSEPTEAEAWWEEYAPYDLTKAPFWCKMPRRMLGKCATALAIRQAYPDLGGLYIPEEMERIAEDHTPSGRQIVNVEGFSPSGQAITHEAQNRGPRQDAKAIAEAKNAGLWCEKHSLPFAKCPSDEHSDGELEAMFQAEQKAKGRNTDGSPVKVEVLPPEKPADAPAPPPEAQEIWPKPPAQEIAPQVAPPSSVAGKSAPVGTPPKGTGAGAPGDDRRRTKGVSTPAAPVLVVGTVEQANPEGGSKPRMNVLFKIDKVKHWMSAWNDKFFPYFTKSKGTGKMAEIYVSKREVNGKTYTNIVGLKTIAGVEFDADGKTPIISVHREPGKTLFP